MDIQARRQFESNNAIKWWEWMFPAEVTLLTSDMSYLKKYGVDYAYESCVFRSDGSDVLDRYDTYEEAKEGHMRLTKELGLTFVNEYFIPTVGRTTIL